MLATVVFLWLSVILRFHPAELVITLLFTALLLWRYIARRKPVPEALPIIFGRKHEKFPEGQALIEIGGAQRLSTADEFLPDAEKLGKWKDNRRQQSPMARGIGWGDGENSGVPGDFEPELMPSPEPYRPADARMKS